MIGKTLAHFEITSLLGKGGMGDVYRARDTKLDREIALKILPTEVATDQSRLDRFEREAKAVAGLNHPHIVTLHSVEEDQGIRFLTMELVEGRTIDGLLTPDGLPLRQILEIGGAIADALAAAHENGIVHRDLKPANVMVTNDGHVKVLDFGLAKLAEESSSPEDSATMALPITAEGAILGTVPYMSPEQLRGQEVDSRSDIFSLGILLYELATGRRPFGGATNADVTSSILKATPPVLTQLKPDLPRHLGRIIAHCLEKEPRDRYHSAVDVRNELRGLRREVESGDSHATESSDSTPPRQRASRAWIGLAAVVLVAVAGYAIWRGGAPSTSKDDASSKPMIVVLPFDNLGPTSDEYFADGMTDEITSHLASITGLGVISRNSAMRYKGSDKPLGTIAEELGVDYVLTGSIRWDHGVEADRVRITPELIRAEEDTSLWSDNYERTLDRIFEVQADIATRIAEAMQVTLLEGEREVIEAIPTENPEAYTYYLRGLEYARGGAATSTGDVQPAIEMLERATELDPNFAEAWASLGMLHANAHHNGIDRTADRLERARAATQRGVDLNPNSAVVNLCMGQYYYWGLKDYETALEWLARAEALRPGDAETLRTFGFVMRRLGRYEEAAEYIQRSLELDPGHLATMTGLMEIYWYTREFDNAQRQMDRIVALHPDDSVTGFYVSALNQAMGKYTTIEEIQSFDDGSTPFMDYVYAQTYFHLRDYERALQAIRTARQTARISELSYYPRSLLEGLVLLYKDGPEAARPSFETALAVLDSLDGVQPVDHRIATAKGYALAGLGRAEEAEAEGRRAVELYPLSVDRYAGTWRLAELARILSLIGKTDGALATLEQVLSIPSIESVGSIQIDPLFDNLRNADGYDELMRQYGN